MLIWLHGQAQHDRLLLWLSVAEALVIAFAMVASLLVIWALVDFDMGAEGDAPGPVTDVNVEKSDD